jgi:hypothetical protein
MTQHVGVGFDVGPLAGVADYAAETFTILGVGFPELVEE